MATLTFTAGRLLSGALIPFALAHVYGIAFLLRRTNALAAPIAVAVLAALLVTSEIAINHRGVCERAQLVSSLTHAS